MNGKKRNPRGKARDGKARGRRSRGPLSLPPGGRRTTRRDQFGKMFGGVIRTLDTMYNREFTVRPTRPVTSDANYSTAQMVNSIAIGTGFNSGSGTGLPFTSAAANANNYISMAFSLQDMANVANFTSIFDQYRFDKVEVKFVPQSNSVALTNVASPNDSNPTLLIVIDNDDATAPTSLAAVESYDNVQAVQYGSGLVIDLIPSNTPAIFASGAFSAYEVQRAGWVDCANTAAAHYGIKGCITALPVASTEICVWELLVKYYVSFRNTR